MPYRIKAKNAAGHTVTRMDQNVGQKPITDRKVAEQTAEAFAQTRGHGGPWTGIVEYYEDSIAKVSPESAADLAKPKLKSGNVWVS